MMAGLLIACLVWLAGLMFIVLICQMADSSDKRLTIGGGSLMSLIIFMFIGTLIGGGLNLTFAITRHV